MEVKREVVLPAERDEVWSALTDPERLQEWFANDVELDLEPGGEGIFRWDDGDERQATVEDVDPGRRISFTWDESHVAESHVAIELDEVEGGTSVVVTETLTGDGAVAEWSSALELRALAYAYA